MTNAFPSLYTTIYPIGLKTIGDNIPGTDSDYLYDRNIEITRLSTICKGYLGETKCDICLNINYLTYRKVNYTSSWQIGFFKLKDTYVPYHRQNL